MKSLLRGGSKGYQSGLKKLELVIVVHGLLVGGYRSEETFLNIASLWEEVVLTVESRKFKVRVFEFDPSFSPKSVWADEDDSSDSSSNSSDEETSKSNSHKQSFALVKAISGENLFAAQDFSHQKVDIDSELNVYVAREHEDSDVGVGLSGAVGEANLWELGQVAHVSSVPVTNHKLSWEESVDFANSVQEPPNVHAKEVENSGYSFPETQKKRGDRALKKCKKIRKTKVILEIVDYSPTDSDIARKHILTRAARKTLAIGKRVGFQIIGNEEDVIEDLVELELQQD
ncbi:hypothetical protein V6N11_056521 [Hibiscus sabdariffa]|uniref:Uncharacterized protein n=1 Tax=Hibiscus sabdariffa TaxID=183260 RepID=A0ABR2T419_9ROSI